MVALEKSLCTKRPIDQVFRYVSDFGTIEQWDPGVVSSRRTTPGPVGPDSLFAIVANYGFGKIPMTYRITEFVPDRKVILHGSGNGFTTTDTIRFSPLDGGTRIDYQVSMQRDHTGPLREKLLQRFLHRLGDRAIKGLDTALNRTFPAPRMRAGDYLLDRTVVGGMAGFTRQGFARHKKKWNPQPEFLDDRTVVITGATSGIGQAAARKIAELGARMIVVGRSAEKLSQTRQELVDSTGNFRINTCRGDLSLMADTRRVAEEILASDRPVHVLINNAGALFNEHRETGEGLEQTLATDLAGPFLLTRLLLPRLEASAPARIINVSSGGMYTQKIRPDDLQYTSESYDGNKAYARAKRGMVILTEMWSQQLQSRGVVVNAMHPGWVDTPGVVRSLPAFYERTRRVLRTPEEGADTIVWLAAAAEAGRVSGRFWLDRRPHVTHVFPFTRESAAERTLLWERLCEMTGEK